MLCVAVLETEPVVVCDPVGAWLPLAVNVADSVELGVRGCVPEPPWLPDTDGDRVDDGVAVAAPDVVAELESVPCWLGLNVEDPDPESVCDWDSVAVVDAVRVWLGLCDRLAVALAVCEKLTDPA